MSKKIWTVKYKPSDHAGIKTDDGSPRSRQDAIDTARQIAGNTTINAQEVDLDYLL